MKFAGHIPGSGNKQRRNMFNVGEQPSAANLSEKDRELKEQNPELYSYKLQIIANIDASQKKESTLRNELRN